MWNYIANCLTIKKIHNNAKGSTAALIFLITINLIQVPVIKIAIISFINHAFGTIKISSIINKLDITNEEVMINIFF